MVTSAERGMRAIRFESFGGPDVLRLVELPRPAPLTGTVVVEIAAAAVNRLDLDERSGTSGFNVNHEGQLGREGAGTVVDVGVDVANVKPGDRVIVSAYPGCYTCTYCCRGEINLCTRPHRPGIDVAGTYASHMVVPQHGLFRLPDAVSFAAGACLQLAYGTAWHGLLDRARVAPGDTVLITGAGGGVGSAAVEVAVLAGATVIAAASTEERRAVARAKGAHLLISSSETDDLVGQVLEHTAGLGVDAVFDATGGPVFAQVPRLLRTGGRYVLYGAHGQERGTIDLIGLFRRYAEVIATRGWLPQNMDRVLQAAAAGQLAPVIAQELALEEASMAHRLLAERSVAGKIVLVP